MTPARRLYLGWATKSERVLRRCIEQVEMELKNFKRMMKLKDDSSEAHEWKQFCKRTIKQKYHHLSMLRKQLPMRIIVRFAPIDRKHTGKFYYCPSCNQQIHTKRYSYCNHCGQRWTWSFVNEVKGGTSNEKES